MAARAARRPRLHPGFYQRPVDWNPFGKSWTNPEKNLRIGLQYTAYREYPGARTHFDGAGTNASDLNTLYFYLWTAI